MIRCVSCGEEYDNDEIIYTCEKCGSVLELVSDFDVSKDISVSYTHLRAHETD